MSIEQAVSAGSAADYERIVRAVSYIERNYREPLALDAAYEVGLSGPGRLHDLFIAYEAMTPGEYKLKGAGLEVRYGFHETRFGEAIVLTTERGLCGLSFVRDGRRKEALAAAESEWPLSRFVADAKLTANHAARAFHAMLDADRDEPVEERERVRVLLRGTNFQVKV